MGGGLNINPPTRGEAAQWCPVYRAPWMKHGIYYGKLYNSRRRANVGNPIYMIKIYWKRYDK